MDEWKQRHHEASVSLEGREEKLDELYEEIEKDLMVCITSQQFGKWLERRINCVTDSGSCLVLVGLKVLVHCNIICNVILLMYTLVMEAFW